MTCPHFRTVSPDFAVALETLVYHELRVYDHTRGKNRPVAFYRTGSGLEIDFIIETKKPQAASPAHVICLEVKNSERWGRRWELPMRSLASEPRRLRVEKMIAVYTGNRPYHFDGIDVLPFTEFLARLHAAEIY